MLARVRRGMLAQDVAKSLGISHTTVRNWERGKGSPRPEQIRSLAGILSVPRNWLCDYLRMHSTSPPDERLLTAEEVARMADVHRASVHRWARAGLLPAIKRPGVRGQFRFRREDVEHFISEMRVA